MNRASALPEAQQIGANRSEEFERIAIITGASRGIGAATALQLAADGYLTVLVARSADALEKVSRKVRDLGGRSLLIPADATVVADLDRVVQQVDSQCGHLDVLVNNAGMLPQAKLAEQLPMREWQQALDLNLTAPWYLASRCKYLFNRGESGGVVVNVTSSASFYPSAGFSAYNATKAGLTMLTRTLAVEWAKDHIRVVGIAPGKVDTEMVQPILRYGERHNIRVNPLGRVGKPSEVASLISFLVSNSARFITGSVISIDGGEVAASGADIAR